MYTIEEQKEHRRLWVEALRSGEYNQGQNALCEKDIEGTLKYCCLGVACKISGLGEFVPVPNLPHPPSVFTFVTKDEQPQYSVLPKLVKEWLGLCAYDGSYQDNNTSLIDLNDEGASFNEIANIIESEPEDLISLSRGE